MTVTVERDVGDLRREELGGPRGAPLRTSPGCHLDFAVHGRKPGEAANEILAAHQPDSHRKGITVGDTLLRHVSSDRMIESSSSFY